jgi:hypothetical protein
LIHPAIPLPAAQCRRAISDAPSRRIGTEFFVLNFLVFFIGTATAAQPDDKDFNALLSLLPTIEYPALLSLVAASVNICRAQPLLALLIQSCDELSLSVFVFAARIVITPLTDADGPPLNETLIQFGSKPIDHCKVLDLVSLENLCAVHTCSRGAINCICDLVRVFDRAVSYYRATHLNAGNGYFLRNPSDYIEIMDLPHFEQGRWFVYLYNLAMTAPDEKLRPLSKHAFASYCAVCALPDKVSIRS